MSKMFNIPSGIGIQNPINAKIPSIIVIVYEHINQNYLENIVRNSAS